MSRKATSVGSCYQGAQELAGHSKSTGMMFIWLRLSSIAVMGHNLWLANGSRFEGSVAKVYITEHSGREVANAGTWLAGLFARWSVAATKCYNPSGDPTGKLPIRRLAGQPCNGRANFEYASTTTYKIAMRRGDENSALGSCRGSSGF